VVHRDLKPQNILIDRDGQPRVTDFGLAKRTQADSQLTGTGQILGTPSYMPPEQAAGRSREIGPCCDVYSLGAVLYCLLTGRPPFQAGNPLDTLAQVLEQNPAPPRLLNAAVPRDLETICLKCLEKDPRRRYSSAAALAQELDRYLNAEPIEASSFNLLDRFASTLQRSRDDRELREWSAVLFWFAALVLLAEAAMFLLAWNAPPYPAASAGPVRAVQFLCMGAVLWRRRGNWAASLRSAGRQMLAIWLGFILACHVVVALLFGVELFSWTTDSPTPLLVYPTFLVLSGMAVFTMGANYWGYCYVWGLVFFAAALATPHSLAFGPLIFGALWAACLTTIGLRLRRLSRGLEPSP
jgi:hypothetical protein